MSCSPEIRVGCRASPLSLAQVKEVQQALPLNLVPYPLNTTGDRDQKTSLRTLDKTDFFTREIDEAQLRGEVRLAVHSAKDLPKSLPPDLVLAALTKGVDPGDALVLRESLKPGARVATSSERREASVRQLYPEVSFVDIRGNIGQRLAKLESGEVDGVVIAEAALIRLGLAPNRIPLPGPTAPLQGQLAILARADDWEMREALLPLDVRTNLYVGLDPCPDPIALPYPVIQIERLTHLKQAPGTHLLITSKTTARLLLEDLPPDTLQDKQIIALGAATGHFLTQQGLPPHHIAQEETSEGVTTLLDTLTIGHLFWPHSQASRRVIPDYLNSRQIPSTEALLYQPLPFRPFTPPPLEHFDQITFTSPSTIEGFLALYGELPQNKELRAKGPVTQEALDSYGTVALGKTE